MGSVLYSLLTNVSCQELGMVVSPVILALRRPVQQGESSLLSKARHWLRKSPNRIKKYIVIHPVVDSYTRLHLFKIEYSFFFFPWDSILFYRPGYSFWRPWVSFQHLDSEFMTVCNSGWGLHIVYQHIHMQENSHKHKFFKNLLLIEMNIKEIINYSDSLCHKHFF